MVFYANPVLVGLDQVQALGDGTTINLVWFQASPSNPVLAIAYHIYYSTIKRNVYTEGVKYVVIDGSLTANIIDLVPGQEYFFSVRPVEYDPSQFNLSLLPIAYDNLRVYPTSLLRSDISATDTVIPLRDISGFPATGIVRIGSELIQYAAVDSVLDNLVVNPDGYIFTNAQLVLQSNNSYYSPGTNNVGTGLLLNLQLVNLAVPTDNWKIECIRIDNGVPIFAAISDIFGAQVGVEYTSAGTGNFGSNSFPLYLDGYGKPFTWDTSGKVVSNGVLSFGISQLTPFAVGDYFLIKVAGSSNVNIAGGRGYNGTVARPHSVGGYDGKTTWNPPNATLFTIGEGLLFDRIYVGQARFEYPNFPGTILDGYKQVLTDYLSTDLNAADAANVGFPEYDFAGWHRTDPVQLLNGTCVGSYIGGEMGCIDGYGNYNIVRGFSLQDQNTQRQDVLLSVDGREAVLLQRVNTGITCSCYLQSSENPDDRCPLCYGTKIVLGYQQYFNPRLSSGHIRVRVSPTDEVLKRYESGLESEFSLDMWTLTVPTIKSRDVIVLFDQVGNEEFRYEVISVQRNNTILGLEGGQHMKTMRVRKTDIIYQVEVFKNTAMFPHDLTTSLSSATGIPFHTHTIRANENDPSTWAQLTSMSAGHSHEVLIVNGIPTVQSTLGHTHNIIF